MRFGIGQKIFGIAAVLALLMVIAATVSIVLLSRVKHQLDVVSHTQLPVSESVGRVAILMLEQGIVLQRLFVLAEETVVDAALIKTARHEYQALSTKIDLELETAHDLMAKHPPDNHEHARVYERLMPGLESITVSKAAFLMEAEALLLALDAGDRATFEFLLPELENVEERLDREIVAFRDTMGAMVVAATAKANEDENLAVWVNAVLTVAAILLGLIFAGIVTRALVRSVHNLVAGARAVERGELDNLVIKTSSDEIGSLTDSFNHMIGELRLKERIKDTFGKYMDPRIVTRLLDRPEITEPGGERREMTVMFIDLKGFTSISEVLSPHDLVRMMNRFFNHMTAAIAENGGVVDKFMGDAVMAFWGPPFTNEREHGELACRAALAALKRLAVFRAEVIEELGEDATKLEIDMRIGVSTGAMIVGTVGSEVSKSYTVVGDPVNLGSRLEGANKAYGTHILVTAETRALVEDVGLEFREIDFIQVKGKTEPVRIFELVDVDSPIGWEERQQFERGLIAYRARDWDASEVAFDSVLAARKDDSVARTYIDRIAHFRRISPPEKWDGVWAFEEK